MCGIAALGRHPAVINGADFGDLTSLAVDQDGIESALDAAGGARDADPARKLQPYARLRHSQQIGDIQARPDNKLALTERPPTIEPAEISEMIDGGAGKGEIPLQCLLIRDAPWNARAGHKR